MGKRIEREKMTIQRMIALYQRRSPEAQADDAHYQALNAYADKRLDKCVFGENKPACKQCPVHCYQPAKREEMKQIMRWAGPRMLWRHPILTVRHLLDDSARCRRCRKNIDRKSSGFPWSALRSRATSRALVAPARR
ncbi:FIG00731873: hypothetical protein [Klebsiella pneumoniae IS46]|nr:FIG00731873: hypothetical protein [Klebsiella pneumoniae IS46]